MSDLGCFDLPVRDRNSPRDPELAELAARQHGVVAHRQLVMLGMRRNAIQHRLGTGRLHPLYIGVYAVGHRAISAHARWMAAVLACGAEAVLSHRSAAALWELRPTSRSDVDVSASRSRSGREGITLHRNRRLHTDEWAVHAGIPVTTVARTLLDLAEVVSAADLARAVEEAERLRLLDVRSIERVMQRSRGRRGLRALADLIDDRSEPPPPTRSELERRFVEVCVDAGLPRPAANVVVAGVEVDMVWADRRLVVELDGYAYHRTRAAFERDRIRDASLALAGYRVLRLTHRRLEHQPAAVTATVRSLLRAPAII